MRRSFCGDARIESFYASSLNCYFCAYPLNCYSCDPCDPYLCLCPCFYALIPNYWNASPSPSPYLLLLSSLLRWCCFYTYRLKSFCDLYYSRFYARFDLYRDPCSYATTCLPTNYHYYLHACHCRHHALYHWKKIIKIISKKFIDFELETLCTGKKIHRFL